MFNILAFSCWLSNHQYLAIINIFADHIFCLTLQCYLSFKNHILIDALKVYQPNFYVLMRKMLNQPVIPIAPVIGFTNNKFGN